MNLERWLFDESRLANSPSRQHGIEAEKETGYMQQVSNFIQEMGRKLQLPLLCINTAVLFTQRFYVFHSLTVFERYSLGAAALFLAAKVEEYPRNVARFSKVARLLMNIDTSDADYIQDLLFNEHALLQTLGFELQVQHPHQHVLRLCDLVKVTKDLSQMSYILATYCLHLTKMCLIYKPTIIACVCIHTACKYLGCEFPVTREGKSWFLCVDANASLDLLECLSEEFHNLLSKCPNKYKNRTVQAYHENHAKNLIHKVKSTDLPIVVGDGKMPNVSNSATSQLITNPSSTDSNMEGLARSLNDQITSFVTHQSNDCKTIPVRNISNWSPIVNKPSTSSHQRNIPIHSVQYSKNFESNTKQTSLPNEKHLSKTVASTKVTHYKTHVAQDGSKYHNAAEFNMRDSLLKPSVTKHLDLINKTLQVSDKVPDCAPCLKPIPSTTLSQEFETLLTSTTPQYVPTGHCSAVQAYSSFDFDNIRQHRPVLSGTSMPRNNPVSTKLLSAQLANSQPIICPYPTIDFKPTVQTTHPTHTKSLTSHQTSPAFNKSDGKMNYQAKYTSSPSTESLKLSHFKNQNSWNVALKNSKTGDVAASNKSIESLKISIPKSKINLQNWPEIPPRTARPADMAVNSQQSLPLTATCSPDRPPLKRFKSN